MFDVCLFVFTYLICLQVYRNVFGSFISAFKTYQPLLSDIKKEYENTLGQWVYKTVLLY